MNVDQRKYFVPCSSCDVNRRSSPMFNRPMCCACAGRTAPGRSPRVSGAAAVTRAAPFAPHASVARGSLADALRWLAEMRKVRDGRHYIEHEGEPATLTFRPTLLT